MTIRFEGSTATVTRAVSRRARLWSVAVATGLVLLGGLAIWLAWAPWMSVLGAVVLLLGPVALVSAVVPDRRIVFDVEAKVVRIARRYPWQRAERMETVPFSAVDSIGVNRTRNEEGGYDYAAVLRLKGRRKITLWRPPSGPDRDLKSSEPDLASLRQLTGLWREDRLD